MQQALAVKQQYPTMRALKTGTYETVHEPENIDLTDADASVPSVSVPGSQIKHKTGKEGSEQKPQRTKLIKLLKKSFTPETLVKEILQMRILMPVEQILSMKEM
jgi:hypothetical protein